MKHIKRKVSPTAVSLIDPMEEVWSPAEMARARAALRSLEVAAFAGIGDDTAVATAKHQLVAR